MTPKQYRRVHRRRERRLIAWLLRQFVADLRATLGGLR